MRPGGGTAYFDATSRAIQMLREARGRKAVLVMTDGVDLNSKKTLKNVVEEARRAAVPVYTIGVGEPGQNTPVTTILVLDHSGSMDEPADDSDRIPKIRALHRAAARFIDIMRPGAQTTLLPFNDEVETPQPFTANKEMLKAQVRRLRAGGGTSLYDAAYDAIQTLVASHAEGKRAVIVMTDGRDESPGSRHRVEDVIEAAKDAQIPLYTLGLGRDGEIDEDVMRRMALQTGGEYHHAKNDQALYDIFENLSIKLHDEGVDEASLQALANETGGKYYPARDISKLREIYEELASELQETYVVDFKSLNQADDGTSRDVGIKIMQNGKIVSNVVGSAYNRPGVVVPETDQRVYLVLLAVIGSLLFLPTLLRRQTRPQTAE
jgi:VWFA-related protein